VSDVKAGKIFYIDLDETDPDALKQISIKMADELLANPIIERYTVTLVE
jgi:phosphoribosylformylglycinamidine (FGAM) synthase PurS component